MGHALQAISGRVTNPGAVITALTPNTGDSFVVRNFQQGASNAYLESMWAMAGTAGVARIRSALLHDNAQGIRQRFTATDPAELLPDEVEQLLYPQDTLTVEMSGGGAETDVLSLLLYYDDLPGVDSRLFGWDQLKPRVQQYMAIECDLTSGATVGQYGGQQAINANFDTLKANTDYAILGYNVDANCGLVGFSSPDFGNLRVGGPGSTRHEVTVGWFLDLSRKSGKPMIPVFNSANKGNTLVDLVHTAAGAAVNLSIICAQLRSS